MNVFVILIKSQMVLYIWSAAQVLQGPKYISKESNRIFKGLMMKLKTPKIIGFGISILKLLMQLDILMGL